MTRCLSFLLILAIFSIYFSKLYSFESTSPIIFVPGLFCSLLEVRINTTLQPSCPTSLHNRWMLLWLNIQLFEPDLLVCFYNIFKLAYNQSSNTFSNPNGVETRTVSNSNNSSFLSGLLWEYIELDQFLAHFISKHSYIDGVNLRSIPYDFRRGANETLLSFAGNLKELIESTYIINKNNSVYIVSHSLGGSMTLFFLSQQSQVWKDRYVHGWISLSGNLAGGIDNIGSLIKGFVSPFVPRGVTRSWDFYAWRLPEPFIYGSQRTIIKSPSRNYTSYDMLDFLRIMGAQELAQIYTQTSSILASLPAPNVNTYCFFGANISTPVGYISKTDTFDDRIEELETINGWGDGELDYTTSMSCQLWQKTMDPKYKLVVKGFDGVTHVGLVGNENVLEQIDQILVI